VRQDDFLASGFSVGERQRVNGGIMRSIAATVLGLLVGLTIYGALCSPAQAKHPPTAAERTARIALVREFVREMEALYRLQETAKREFAEDGSSARKLATGIRVGTRTLFEMRESISRLEMIGVDGRWAEFRDLLKSFHKQRMATVQEMNEIAKAILSGPAPGVKYGAMTARAPELTAQVEQIDKSMFTISRPMFFALVDEGRVEADGNLHHLVLKKKDRADMVHTIDSALRPIIG
jgi:hypothetical protein